MNPPKSDVIFVLALVQAGTILLAGLGELLFMGGLFFYLFAPMARAALLVVCGALALRGSRPALVFLIVLESLSLTGFVLSGAVGLLPWVDFTVTLTGLATTVVLPVVVIAYCARLLGAGNRRRGSGALARLRATSAVQVQPSGHNTGAAA